jgi:type IV pilus assembly protein PilA
VYRSERGFTLIELMVVVVIIGVLAAIAIPNFIAMMDRAREANVKANMHSFQLATEDFAVKNQGIYPVVADAAGVKANMPSGTYPTNPFTGAVDQDPETWGGPATAQGRFATDATISGYTITGFGKSAAIALALTNG